MLLNSVEVSVTLQFFESSHLILFLTMSLLNHEFQIYSSYLDSSEHESSEVDTFEVDSSDHDFSKVDSSNYDYSEYDSSDHDPS